ncbi:SDR family NAD(P)-dependent oxidoreductase [Natronoglycomyces albus]|uniref:SDR family oxidoreductase n=1 Tax=Natronoglycomyces albus TaxID=2811108 RepID=A0A895XMZ4_9ACTN|nr:SDR family oxidoreductase [Natronoglycomyces albus]QSB04769.1 SDR family oxidoreductase [Natronoglycomyces albus]
MEGLAGKVGIVTGAASGIGRATARKLAACGVSVVVSDINLAGAEETVQLIVEAKGTAIAQQTDVGSEPALAAMVEKAVATYGALHLLHSNAANTELVEHETKVAQADADLWDLTFDVNARSALLGAKYAIGHMITAGGGSIVNTSSATGQFGEPHTRTAYAASKAAVDQLTRTIATQYGKQGIRANAVAPGAVRTPNFDDGISEEVLDLWRRNHLTPDVGKPEDVANAVAFLLSDLAGFITGQVLNVDGGLTIHSPLYSEMLLGREA